MKKRNVKFYLAIYFKIISQHQFTTFYKNKKYKPIFS